MGTEWPMLVSYGDFGLSFVLLIFRLLGDYEISGEAFSEVQEESGQTNYNVQLKAVWNEAIMSEAMKDKVLTFKRKIKSSLCYTNIPYYYY